LDEIVLQFYLFVELSIHYFPQGVYPFLEQLILPLHVILGVVVGRLLSADAFLCLSEAFICGQFIV
jgi:hypothetical protein